MISLKEAQLLVSQNVVGQTEAIKTVTTSIYKYLLKQYARDFGHSFNSTTLLLLGDSGVGKTFIIKQAAKVFNLCFIECNSMSISKEGWVGIPFSKMVLHGFEEYYRTHSSVRTGAIIFIDEFDKICTKNYSSGGDDVNFHIQSSLLKYIEGFPIDHINTNKCMFILAGAFSGLDIENKKTIGFSKETNQETQDFIKLLIKYGMLPEIAGRVQEYCKLSPLKSKDYKKILETDEFCLSGWKEIFFRLGVEFSYDCDKLIETAIKTNLGARGLIQALDTEITRCINDNIDAVDLEKFSPLYTKRLL